MLSPARASKLIRIPCASNLKRTNVYDDKIEMEVLLIFIIFTYFYPALECRRHSYLLLSYAETKYYDKGKFITMAPNKLIYEQYLQSKESEVIVGLWANRFPLPWVTKYEAWEQKQIDFIASLAWLAGA